MRWFASLLRAALAVVVLTFAGAATPLPSLTPATAPAATQPPLTPALLDLAGAHAGQAGRGYRPAQRGHAAR